jgi:hypothetical protein
MKGKFFIFYLAGLLLSISPCHAHAEQVAGWLEWARLENYDIKFKAKLDTGAKHSSINAEDLKVIVKAGKRYARFTVANKSGDSVTIEKPIIRMATIKRHYDKFQERPVIMLKICIGGFYKEAEVNLVDRSGLNYQFLIGRSYLAGDLHVDSGSIFLLSRRCK